MSDPKLKEAMAEIKGILKKHDIAGYVNLFSKTSVEFLFEVTPSWSALMWEGQSTGTPLLRFKVKEKEVGKEKAKELSELTCHIVYQLRDMSAQGFKFADEMIKLIETKLEVDHNSFSDFEPHQEN